MNDLSDGKKFTVGNVDLIFRGQYAMELNGIEWNGMGNSSGWPFRPSTKLAYKAMEEKINIYITVYKVNDCRGSIPLWVIPSAYIIFYFLLWGLYHLNNPPRGLKSDFGPK